MISQHHLFLILNFIVRSVNKLASMSKQDLVLRVNRDIPYFGHEPFKLKI